MQTKKKKLEGQEKENKTKIIKDQKSDGKENKKEEDEGDIIHYKLEKTEIVRSWSNWRNKI